MYTILIAIIVGSIIGLYNASKTYWASIGDYILFSIIGSIFGFIVGCIIATALPMSKCDKHYSYNIVNLQDNNSIKGNFFLGSGQIEGKMKYVFYYEENGLYKMNQIDYDKVSIKYSDDQAKVNVTEVDLTDSLINYFGIDWDLGNKTYIIEVPKGTIQNNYSLDAK